MLFKLIKKIAGIIGFKLVDKNLIKNDRELTKYAFYTLDKILENIFDVVICECLLPQQNNPTEMARHCASFLDSGGIFVATCHDMVSTLSETLRSLPGWLLVRDDDGY